MPTKELNGSTVPAPELASAVQAPANLEQSVETVQDIMRQYLWESMAVDGTSTNLSNFLIALTAYGLYRGVTHPTSANIASTAAVGSAAYAYGTSNKLGPRAAAYTDGFRRLNCSLSAAAPYRIVNSADSTGNLGTSTLADAIKTNQTALVNLEGAIDGLSEYNTELVNKEARPSGSACPGTWKGAKWANDANRFCHVPSRPRDAAAPHPAVSAAIGKATDQAEKMRSNLTQASALFAASRSMGTRLWENSNFIVGNTADAVRGTIPDPLDAIARVKSFMAQQTAAPAPAALPPALDAQSNRTQRITGKTRDLSEEARQALDKLNATLRRARLAHQELQSILDQNHPPALSFEQIDRCRSTADEVVQGIALATAKNAAPAAPPAPAPKENQLGRIVDAQPDIWQGLDFTSMPAPADLNSRVEQCQQKIGVPPDAKRWEAVGDVIRAGKCKGLAWK